MNPLQVLNYFINHDHIMALLSLEQRSRLLNTIVVEKFDCEQTVFVKNSSAHYLYCLIEGEIALNQGTEKSALTIAIGQYFGLDAIIPAQYYNDTAVTVQPSVVLKIPAISMQLLIENNASISNYFLKMIAMHTRRNVIQDNIKSNSSKNSDLLSVKIIYQWLMSLGLPAVLYTILQFLHVDQSLNIFCCTSLFGTTAWALNIVPAYAASILMLIVFLATGIVPSSIALSGFGSESFLTLFCLYGLFNAMLTSGLVHRSLLLALKYLPPSQWWINTYVFVTGIVLTILIPEANKRNKFSSPILIDLINFTGLKAGSPAVTRLVTSSFNGNSLLSTIFYHGSIYNFLLLTMLWSQEQERFCWDGWLEAAIVPGVMLLTIQIFVIGFNCFNSAKLNLDRARIDLQNSVYGRLSIKEWAVICATGFLIIGLSTINFHRMTALSIYLLMFIILTLVHAIDRKSSCDNTNWTSLLLFAGLSGVIMVAHYLQINSYFVSHLNWLGLYIKNNFTTFILLLSLFSAVIRLFLPYGLTVIILASVLVPVAQAYEINSWLMCFICLTTAKIWFFSYQNSAYRDLKFNLHHHTQFDEKTVLFNNAVLNICLIITLLMSQYYWIRLGFL